MFVYLELVVEYMFVFVETYFVAPISEELGITTIQRGASAKY